MGCAQFCREIKMGLWLRRATRLMIILVPISKAFLRSMTESVVAQDSSSKGASHRHWITFEAQKQRRIQVAGEHRFGRH